MEEMVGELRQDAAKLLTDGVVDVVVGYGRTERAGRVMATCVRSPEETDRLVLNGACQGNLVVYLKRVSPRGPVPAAVVARPADMRSAIVLAHENQLDPDKVRFLGIEFREPAAPDTAASYLGILDIPAAESLVKERFAEAPFTEAELAQLQELEALSPEERWQYWSAQFEKCVRCYACRQVCPLCYCDQCSVEKNQPQWVPTSGHAQGNFLWHVMRSMHLAGRCVNCGACEQACPEQIPLCTLYRAMARRVNEAFDFLPGLDREAPAALETYSSDDEAEFFL